MPLYFGTRSNDWINGSSGNDSIHGLGGNDILFGNSGHDFIAGNEGTDFLYGGMGWDTLRGGTGRDYLSGGSEFWETDTFQFAVGDSGTTTATADVITDFMQFDRLDVGDGAVHGSERAFVNTRITAIEQGVQIAELFDRTNGSQHDTAVMFSNTETRTTFLVLDQDANGSYETGIVLQGLWLQDRAEAESFLDTWLV